MHYQRTGSPAAGTRSQTVTTSAAGAASLIGDPFASYLPLHAVVPEQPPGTSPGPPWVLNHYSFDGASWTRADTVSTNAYGPGCLIRSSISDGPLGNLEVVVLEGSGSCPLLVRHRPRAAPGAGPADQQCRGRRRLHHPEHPAAGGRSGRQRRETSRSWSPRPPGGGSASPPSPVRLVHYRHRTLTSRPRQERALRVGRPYSPAPDCVAPPYPGRPLTSVTAAPTPVTTGSCSSTSRS